MGGSLMAKKRYFLAYELDAFDNAASIGTSCGIPVQHVTHGNLLLWRHVWRTQSDLVTTAHVQAFFGVNACEALVLFGHLEATPDGWRVRGAAEWLRVMTAQSEAGKAKSGNLQRGREDLKKLSGSSPASAPKRAEAGDKPTGSTPALTATSDQRPATSLKGSAAEKPAAPPGPRLKPLGLLLEADYLEARGSPYKHQGAKDTLALKELLSLATDEEIRSRWRQALDLGDTWPGCSTVAQLGSKWNDLAAPRAGPKKSRGERFDPNEGIIRSSSYSEHQCNSPDCPACGPFLAAVSESAHAG